jgi:hypothetical protein
MAHRHNRDASGAGLPHRLDRVLQHVGGIHDRFDGVVQLSAGGRKIVLVLDKDQGSGSGVHHLIVDRVRDKDKGVTPEVPCKCSSVLAFFEEGDLCPRRGY